MHLQRAFRHLHCSKSLGHELSVTSTNWNSAVHFCKLVMSVQLCRCCGQGRHSKRHATHLISITDSFTVPKRADVQIAEPVAPSAYAWVVSRLFSSPPPPPPPN